MAPPQPVQRILFPVIAGVGRALGWDRRFAGAPQPVRRSASETKSKPREKGQ
jgi:hypothetical protein